MSAVRHHLIVALYYLKGYTKRNNRKEKNKHYQDQKLDMPGKNFHSAQENAREKFLAGKFKIMPRYYFFFFGWT
jgi:hypothetical protein